MDVVHVLGAGPDVLGGDVAPAKTLDKTTVGAKDRLTVLYFVVADDDGLSTTKVQPGDGILVGHAARKSERVGDRFFVGRVLPEPGPAERRPELGAVDSENSPVSDRGIAAHHDLLMSHLGERIEQLHFVLIQKKSYDCPYRARAITILWISEVPS